MITHLTPDQTARFQEFVQRWTEIGLSTAPTDKKAAELAIRECYERAGLATPARIVWLKSPIGGALCRAILTDRSVRASVRDSVRASVGDSVWASVRASVRDSVGDSVRASVRASIRDSVWASVYGLHEAPWLAFYDYFLQVCNLKCCEKLSGLSHQAQHCGWWWPYQKFVIATEKPVHIHLDDRGRLHCDHRSAIGYGDTWGVWSWHGVRVPQWAIEDQWLPKTAITHDNAEVRRALIEIYDHRNGKGRFIQECGAKVIDSAIQPMREGRPDCINDLLAIDLPGDPDGRMVALKVIDPSTGREYVIRVSPDQKTVRGALAWSWDLKPEEYVLEQES